MYTSNNNIYNNFNRDAYKAELGKRGDFYTNVIMWTTLFSLPLFFLLDYFILKEQWESFILLRLIGFGTSYIVYTLYKNKVLGRSQALLLFIGINVVVNSIVCGVAPPHVKFSYFIILGIVLLVINTTVLWKSKYSLIMSIISVLILIFIASFSNRVDKYSVLVNNGGGLYFLFCCVAYVVSYTRYGILKNDLKKSVQLSEANTKLIQQNEQLKAAQQGQASGDLFYAPVDEKPVLPVFDVNKPVPDMPQATSIAVNSTLPKVEQHEVFTNREELNFNPMVEVIAIDLIDAIYLKKQNLQLNISPAASKIYQEKRYVQELLDKALSTIIRHSEAGSTIIVTAEKEAAMAVLECVSHPAKMESVSLTDSMQEIKDKKAIEQFDVEKVGLSNAKTLAKNMGGNLYYNLAHDNSNYLKIELPITSIQ